MVQAVIPTTVTGLQGRPVAATPAPTNNQALVWNGSAWVPGGPYLTAAGAPYFTTNYVDNSGFTINQRGYSSGGTLAAGAYGLDRWKAGASGCTLTFSASPSSTVVTIAAGTLQQVIEGAVLFNSSYTLSWLGSATGRINAGSYVASPITFTGAPATNVTIEFQGGTLGQVLLQVGTQATLWQPQPFAVELQRCQRFFFNTAGGTAFGGYFTAGAMLYSPFKFPVSLYAVPTATIALGSPNNISSAGLQAVTQDFLSIFLEIPVQGAFTGTLAFFVSADL